MLRATAVWSQIQDDGLNSAGWKKKSEKKKGMCKQLYTGFRFTNQDMVWTVTMWANAHVLPHIHPVYISMLVNVRNIYIPSYLYICINDQKKKKKTWLQCVQPLGSGLALSITVMTVHSVRRNWHFSLGWWTLSRCSSTPGVVIETSGSKYSPDFRNTTAEKCGFLLALEGAEVGPLSQPLDLIYFCAFFSSTFSFFWDFIKLSLLQPLPPLTSHSCSDGLP